MAGIALVLDLLNKNSAILLRPTLLHSHGFSAKAAISSAATSAVVTAPFAAWAFLGKGGSRIVHCDAGVAPIEDYSSSIDQSTFRKDAVHYGTKEYTIELKPILSAFHWKTFTLTSLRSFLLFYLPLLEPRTKMEDDDIFLQDSSEEQKHVDLVDPFKKSLKQILRETTVVTARRLLERCAIHYVSQRMAWKLLKDVPKSAARKAARGMPTHCYLYCVCKTTFRGHCLGVLASWMVQVGIDVYRFFTQMLNSQEEMDEVDRREQVKLLGKKVSVATVRCCSSLVFASVGAGIGAVIFRPSTGQWIGCAAGDLAGPVIVGFCFERIFHITL